MRIHCPSCKSPLTVGPSAAGKSGRCPVCKGTFQVPLVDDLLDDAIGELLQEEPDVSGSDDIPPPPQPSPFVPMKKRDYMPRKPGQQGSPPPPAQAAPASAGPGAGASKPPAAAAKSGIQVTDTGKKVYVVRSAMSHGVKPAGELVPDLSRPAPAAAAPGRAAQHEEGNGVRLRVTEVTSAGVRLRFDMMLLARPAFRASMPMWCAGCGEQDPARLIARPLAWMDRASHAGGQNPADVEAQYSVDVQQGQTVRDIVQSMRRLDHLHAPLSSAMPYFVCRDCAGHITLECVSYTTGHGNECEVKLPSGGYALAWLGRVNGVCGEEYEQLEQAVRHLESDAWRDLDHAVRDRVGVWFKFQGGERFLGFFNEAEFPRKDAGLGGLVITDQRLVYCKYNHKGMVPLHGSGDLLLMCDGLFTDISHQHEGHQRKLVRIRSEEIRPLIEAIHFAGTTLNVLKVEAVKGHVHSPPMLHGAPGAPPAPEEKPALPNIYPAQDP